MLRRIPRPRPTGGSAPRPIDPVFTHFQGHNGRSALSIWYDMGGPSLPRLFSFQVYITHDASPTENPDREALADELFETILGEHFLCQRLDLHFLRPGETTNDCIESHRALAQTKHTDLAKVVITRYTRSGVWPSHSFIYVVSDTDWKEVGLKGVFFDFDPTHPRAPADPVSERALVGHDIEEIADILFSQWSLRDDYKNLFRDAHEAGMTEWVEVFRAANRLGMDQW
ncbi:hypothetical protein HDK90DRAFT_558155 [Phyllosticta capitalensis]|uniref:Uncharacterized protein n=1 Tax=Phyllosticta capitalensis TaxID=121624 RepID=A0ABR1YH98_9PEZI